MRESKKKTTIQCTNCNAYRRRINRYYRNGKYYCNKKCFKKHQLKLKEEKDGKRFS